MLGLPNRSRVLPVEGKVVRTSALARNYPGMLTESDPPAQRGRG